MPEAVSDREQRILEIIETARSKRARFRDEQINMAHGAGGKATQTLIEGLFVPAFGGESLEAMADAGALSVDGVELAMTTDSFVVKPIRFPGGSIGELAVNGTVNDLAVTGARPLALSLSLVLEEGLSADALRAEVAAIASAAETAQVEIVAGDTKVVERGHADSMYICTTGVGRRESLLEHERERQRERPRAGDGEVVDGAVHGQLADRAAREADRLDDEAVGGQRQPRTADLDGAGVAELGERLVGERRQQQALDQRLGRLAAGAVRHRDPLVAELRLLRARRLDDPEDPLLAGRGGHTASRSWRRA